MHLIKNTNAASFALRYIGRRLFKQSEPASLNEAGLFSGQPQHQNFCRIDQLAPVSRMPASSKPYFFPQKNSISFGKRRFGSSSNTGRYSDEWIENPPVAGHRHDGPNGTHGQ